MTDIILIPVLILTLLAGYRIMVMIDRYRNDFGAGEETDDDIA